MPPAPPRQSGLRNCMLMVLLLVLTCAALLAYADMSDRVQNQVVTLLVALVIVLVLCGVYRARVWWGFYTGSSRVSPEVSYGGHEHEGGPDDGIPCALCGCALGMRCGLCVSGAAPEWPKECYATAGKCGHRFHFHCLITQFIGTMEPGLPPRCPTDDRYWDFKLMAHTNAFVYWKHQMSLGPPPSPTRPRSSASSSRASRMGARSQTHSDAFAGQASRPATSGGMRRTTSAGGRHTASRGSSDSGFVRPSLELPPVRSRNHYDAPASAPAGHSVRMWEGSGARPYSLRRGGDGGGMMSTMESLMTAPAVQPASYGSAPALQWHDNAPVPRPRSHSGGGTGAGTQRAPRSPVRSPPRDSPGSRRRAASAMQAAEASSRGGVRRKHSSSSPSLRSAASGKREPRHSHETSDAIAEDTRALRAAMEEMKEQQLCPVCLENQKNMVFGCGHRVCDTCGMSLANCPMCRAEVSTRIKLYD